jgi:hypothetical protein
MVGEARIVRLLGYRDPEAKVLAAIDRRVAALLEAQELVYDITRRFHSSSRRVRMEFCENPRSGEFKLLTPSRPGAWGDHQSSLAYAPGRHACFFLRSI